jgi:hypothetical protein
VIRREIARIDLDRFEKLPMRALSPEATSELFRRLLDSVNLERMPLRSASRQR